MTLAEEAQRYLAIVEIFRREGYEPHWQPETTEQPQSNTTPMPLERSTSCRT
jgi:hypothetical protein